MKESLKLTGRILWNQDPEGFRPDKSTSDIATWLQWGPALLPWRQLLLAWSLGPTFPRTTYIGFIFNNLGLDSLSYAVFWDSFDSYPKLVSWNWRLWSPQSTSFLINRNGDPWELGRFLGFESSDQIDDLDWWLDMSFRNIVQHFIFPIGGISFLGHLCAAQGRIISQISVFCGEKKR